MGTPSSRATLVQGPTDPAHFSAQRLTCRSAPGPQPRGPRRRAAGRPRGAARRGPPRAARPSRAPQVDRPPGRGQRARPRRVRLDRGRSHRHDHAPLAVVDGARHLGERRVPAEVADPPAAPVGQDPEDHQCQVVPLTGRARQHRGRSLPSGPAEGEGREPTPDRLHREVLVRDGQRPVAPAVTDLAQQGAGARRRAWPRPRAGRTTGRGGGGKSRW